MSETTPMLESGEIDGAPSSKLQAPSGKEPGARSQESGAGSQELPSSVTPEFLLDVHLDVSVEVGRVQMPVREVLSLGPGSVIELQRAAGEPVEVFANGRCIGRGEIVVVGDQFGVRITELGRAA
jgi:flagellar motor switch protein FliN/FliY